MRIALALLLLALSHPAWGADQKLVDELLEYEKVENALEGVQNAFLLAIARVRNAEKMTAAQAEKIERLGKRIYRGKNLFEVFRLAYAKHAKDIDVAAKLRWIKTPIGKKFYQAVADNHAPGAHAKMKAYFDRHAKATLKGNRLNVLNTFVTTSKQLEIIGETHKMAEFGVLMGLNGFRPASSRDQSHYLIKKLDTKAATYQKLAHDEVMMAHVYLFRSLTNDDVDMITDFYRSPAGLATSATYLKALSVTLEKAGITLMNAVAGR